jgi:hypothetical protein
MPLPKKMEYILMQEAAVKGIDASLLKGNNFSHVIIKEMREDERMYLATMVKRLLHCCPYHEEVKGPLLLPLPPYILALSVGWGC